MHITRQLNPINCIKEFSFVVESCSKCISPQHYTTISIHELTILSNTVIEVHYKGWVKGDDITPSLKFRDN